MRKDYDYIIDIEGAERRFFTSKIDIRAEEGDAGVIEGIAAVIDSVTDMGWYKEKIERGAFDDVLMDDVVALFNHNPNYPLARSNEGKGTLELFITQEGHLGYRYKTPDRSYAKDLMDAIRAGDVNKSSFAFDIKEQTWIYAAGKEPDMRVIKKLARLYDVSPVTYPAYQNTAVAARSLEQRKRHDQQVQEMLRRDAFERDQLLIKVGL